MTKEIFDTLVELADKYTLKNPSLPLLTDSNIYNPYVKNLDEKLTSLHKNHRTLLLPNFHNSETVAVFSDYGGEHKECNFHTYSFLFCTFEFMNMYNEQIKNIRAAYGLLKPYKEIAFKNVSSYGPLKRALSDILDCANNLINGLLVTVVVDKRIHQLFGLQNKEFKNKIYSDLKANSLNVWKDKILEKLLYIVNTICYFTKLLSVKDQKFFWMTDNDAIIGNKVQEEACMNIMYGTLRYFLGDDYLKIFQYAKPFDENCEYDFTSLLSIPDLVAGALSDYFQHTKSIKEPMIGKDETDLIMDFISRQGILLKKYSIMFNFESDTSYSLGSLSFHSSINKDKITIPIYY